MAGSEGTGCKKSEVLTSSDNFKFHMVYDKKTEMYVKFAKVMVICQGPYTDDRIKNPINVAKVFKSASRILSDETFVHENVILLKPENTEYFYDYLKEGVKDALETGYNLIYIDSSMPNVYQNLYYCSLANKMQYVTLIMPPFVKERESSFPKESLAYSFKLLDSQIKTPNMFQHLFCGWFLHDRDTEELQNECSLYVDDLFEGIDDFGPWFSKVSSKLNFRQYYGLDQDYKSRPDLKEDLAFCPVKIFSSKSDMTDYFSKPQVADNYGKMSKLKIVGFIISPHMIAARIKLTYHQKPLWEMDDIVREDSHNLLCPTKLYKESKENLPDIKVQRIYSKSNTTLVKAEKVEEPTEIIPPNARGRTCHIVIGSASDAPAVNIDYDVAFALSREYKANKEKMNIDLINVKNFQVKRIGKYWFIYLHDTLTVNGLFASCAKPVNFDVPVKYTPKMSS